MGSDRESCDVEDCQNDAVADLLDEEHGLRCYHCLMLDLELKPV